MGLSPWLAHWAVAGAQLLVVEAPGAWSTRVAVEQAMGERGWRPATSPADADVLLVCGRPGSQLAEAIDRVWEQLPGPRARVDVPDPDAAQTMLRAAEALLLDHDHQREDAQQRAVTPKRTADPGVNHQEMKKSDMDHGGMEMSGPGGIALAGGGPDRDGLEMDVLHLPLGPVLPHWPPGLVLRCSLQGDVVVEAEVDVVDSDSHTRADGSPPSTAWRCDAAADVLTLAGWEAMAAEARRTRDVLLVGADPARGVAGLDRLHARIGRSRLLRWSLRGLGRVDEAMLTKHHLPDDRRGDVHDRLLRLLASPDEMPNTVTERSAVVAALPTLVRGYDVAAARLVVASHAPLPVHSSAPAHRGGGHV